MSNRMSYRKLFFSVEKNNFTR